MRGALAPSPIWRAQGSGFSAWQVPCAARRVRCLAKGPGGKREKPTLADKLREGNAVPQMNVFEAPSVSSSPAADAPSTAGGAVAASSNELQTNILQVAWRRLLRELSSLPRAISIMALVATLSGLGTFIPQNKPLDFYFANYPAAGPDVVLGFLTYDVVLGLQLDHIYTADYFYAAIALLGASLAACTATRQLPAVKVAQRWRFLTQPASVAKQGAAEVLPNARVRDVGVLLEHKGYQVFLRPDGALYAFKGLAGKVGPVGVHAALLLCLAGTAWSGFGTTRGSVMCPEGQDFTVASALRPASPLASLPSSAADAVVHVNGFSIDYRPDGSVAQFYSDLSLLDGGGGGGGGTELLRKTISVNDPFRFQGVTMYQTDWSLSAVTLRVLGQEAPLARAAAAAEAAAATAAAAAPAPAPAPAPASTSTSPPAPAPASASASASSSPELAPTSTAPLEPSPSAPSPASSALPVPPTSASEPGPSPSPGPSAAAEPPRTAFSLPMASLEGKPGVAGRLWATFLPLGEAGPAGGAPRGISILARDPQSVVFYDAAGQFVGVRRPGSGKPITVEGVQVVVEAVVGATGLELKSDPGVPLVYAGFAGLMVTTLVSYLSHSQVWALQSGPNVFVAGRTNRAKLAFEAELNTLLNAVPELPPPPPQPQAPAPAQQQQQQ